MRAHGPRGIPAVVTREVEVLGEVAVFATLAGALALFVWDRFRYDVVALLALLSLALARVVPTSEVFSGFGNPAVVTVAAVLVVGRALTNAGLVDLLAGWMASAGRGATRQVAALGGLVTVGAAFMQNIGALAVLMPVGLRLARRGGTRPSQLMIPLASASLLGGLVTLIGAPPNIIIAQYRAGTGAPAFGMFAFAPVGLGVALAGLAFLSVVGWRLLPRRSGAASREELFAIAAYTSELRLREESPWIGGSLREAEAMAAAHGTNVIALVRDGRHMPPHPWAILREDDVLVVEADAAAMQSLMDEARLDLAEEQHASEEALRGAEDVDLLEAVLPANSPLVGATVRQLNVRRRLGVNVVGVAREGGRLGERTSHIRFRPGDVLLLQGDEARLAEAVRLLGCLPLADRGLRLGQPRRLALAGAIFAAAVALSALGVVHVAVALAGAAVALVLTRAISLKEAYESIDWPIVVLLGAMLPVATAMQTTGGAQRLADGLVHVAAGLPAAGILGVVLVATILLSNVINNAAAALLMAPVAVGVGHQLAVSTDPFLMAVAIGSSATFLTPISNQCNVLVMGPGGYRFGDYWRSGLPLTAVVVAVAIPLLLHFWPLALHGGA